METSSLVVAVAAVGVGVGLWAAVAVVRRAVEARLGLADAELRRLADASARGESGAGEVRREVAALRDVLEDVRAREEERRRREEEAWSVLHRVSAVLTGAQQAGRVGENVLRDALAQLPPSMLQRDFRVGGRVVEFAIVLPDGRRLPLDSKWSAESDLLALRAATDPEERDRLVQAVEREVARRAREVAQYRDPSVTAPLSVAAIPDAAYSVLKRAHAEAWRHGVVVIPYSMALPVTLFLHSIVSRLGGGLDVEACVGDLQGVLDAIEATLENRLERASTMLANGVGEVRAQVGKARTTLAAARRRGHPPDERPDPSRQTLSAGPVRAGLPL